MNDEDKTRLAALVGRWGVAEVVRVAEAVGDGGPTFRERRIAAGASRAALAGPAAAALGLQPLSLAQRLAAWETHGGRLPAHVRAALVAALEDAEARAAARGEGAPPADPAQGAELLDRWQALDIPVARWAERVSAEAGSLSARSATAAIYGWASGRAVPGPRVRAAIVATLEAAEGAAAAAAEARAAVAPAARRAVRGAGGGLSFDDLLAREAEADGGSGASTDTGSGVGKGAGSGGTRR